MMLSTELLTLKSLETTPFLEATVPALPLNNGRTTAKATD